MNGDAYVSTGQGILGTNMFAYCLDNPVNMVDEHGDLSISATRISSKEIKFSVYLTDTDIRLIKFGIISYAAVCDAALVILGALGALPTAGTSVAASIIAGATVTLISALSVAYIDLMNNGKGATIEIYVKFRREKIYAPTFRSTWWGFWYISFDAVYTDMPYSSRSTIKWNR